MYTAFNPALISSGGMTYFKDVLFSRIGKVEVKLDIPIWRCRCRGRAISGTRYSIRNIGRDLDSGQNISKTSDSSK